MAETTARGSGSTNNNTGAIYTGGFIGSNLFSQVSLGVHIANKEAAITKNSGLMGALKATAVTLTSVADNSGKCRFTKNSHGLSAGDIIEITGSTASSLNTVHVITVIDSANTFTTDIAYAASATAGDYQKLTGTRNVLSDYIIPATVDSLAGVANTKLKTAGGYGPVTGGIQRSVTERRIDIDSWDYVTGTPTYGANSGDSYTFKAAQGSGDVDSESLGVGNVVIYDGNLVPYSREYESIF